MSNGTDTLLDTVASERADTAAPATTRVWWERPRMLLLGFVVAHLALFAALLPSMLNGHPLGDLSLYRRWAEGALGAGHWPGVSESWVYPVGAVVPVIVAELAGPLLFELIWVLLTTALNGLATWMLARGPHTRARYLAAWWWLLLVVVLSPVDPLRLDGLTAPMVVIALVMLARCPAVAGVILAAATWIKVWPAAVLLAVFVTARRRWVVAAAAAALTAVVVAVVIAFGGGAHIASFATEQSDRAIQLEAPVATPWVWMTVFGIPAASIWLNRSIATQEVYGPGDSVVAACMTPAMLVAVLGILILAVMAHRRSKDSRRVLLVAALALTAALIVFNKVGSPQYMLWLVPPIAVGLVWHVRQWRVPAILMIAIAALTTLVFPILYVPLTNGDALAASVLLARNLLLIMLLGWAIWRLVRLTRASTPLR
ncbi:glycosyltransferase 87 family protein [Leifsonia sp. Root112D2]|uniref:glycosyltransferase 87 family protein n=1 Tax=Leifsonia sp. Root112D2 TaxID=1736426 RepID=UPI0006FAA3D4|nr:glycosyltransferase 87 family protein [Leifsonia sp. Root112D2]KQV06842.1 hypothetical protein ASC63_05580 [Leifsonia sp. Root112D2]